MSFGKYIAKCDWMIGNIINDEPYCDVCGEIVTDAINKLLKNIPEIRARTEYGIRVLIEALLLAGVTIMIIGHTRAVASVEHNIAHYWEMQQMLRGNRAPSHGASVGVATLMVWPMFKKFASEDISNLDMDAIRAKRLNRAEREQWMISAYGEANARAIMSENEGDFLTWEERRRRILRAQQRISDIRAAIALMPEYDEICRGNGGTGRAAYARRVRRGRRSGQSVHALRQTTTARAILCSSCWTNADCWISILPTIRLADYKENHPSHGPKLVTDGFSFKA